MLVQHITLSIGRERMIFQSLHDDFQDAIITALEHTCPRIAFGGHTSLGRAGIVIEADRQRISGHKIDPLPATLPDTLGSFALRETFSGLEQFTKGVDVLIGTEKSGIMLRWIGEAIEVFGAGEDSEHSGSRQWH